MQNLTHQQAWDNITNYFKHAEGLQNLKAQGKIEGMAANDLRTVVPGRFATTDKNMIATALTKGDLALADTTAKEGLVTAGTVSQKDVQAHMNVFGVDEATARQNLATKAQQTLADTTVPSTPSDRLAAWEKLKQANPNAAWANNPNVDKQVTNLINTIHDPQELHKAINKIETQIGLEGIPKDYAAKMAKDGYIAIVPNSHNLPVVPFSETAGKLVTNSASGNFFEKAATPIPVLRSVGAALTWAGLSPVTAGQRVSDLFKQNFEAGMSKLGFMHLAGDTSSQTATDTLAKLSNYMKAPTGGLGVAGHYLPITDMRQLTTGDIMRALSVGRSEAKAVGEAIMQAHLDVPRQVAGLGDKLISANYKLNPLASSYSRVQGAFRFAWNPIFRQGKLPLKAEFLSQMQTGGKFPTVAGTNTFMSMFFPGKYKQLNEVVSNPEFKKLLPGGMGGEATDAAGYSVAAPSQYPKTALYPVAGVIQSMADRVGLDTATYIKNFPQEVNDAATAILHYDHNNSFLNSPMARTLNVAFFPFRFNVKVSTFMAKSLANLDPVVQYAAVKGIMDAHKFLNSPQGQAWYSQNADAIGLFKYFSPVETISTISSALGLKHDSVAQYGELGGLPFGWIPQMLDSVGLTHFNQPYVNPKTGAINTTYVPKNMYGAANAAIQDLLGSLFTYPGATAGLPSKSSLDRKVVGGLLPGSSKDFNKVTPTNLTPQDRQFSQTIQQANGSQNPNTPVLAPPQPGTKVPAQSSPITTPRSASGSKKAKTPRLKKADFRPQLLPGQSTLGQL
jgi:hypothetical protein